MTDITRRNILGLIGSMAVIPQFPHMSVAKSDDGVFDLVAKEGSQSLYYDDSPPSDLWTYNGKNAWT